MKKLLYGLLIGAGLMVTGAVFAAPSAQNFVNVQPFTTDTYNNGSASLEWNNLYTKTVCLSGDCKSSWTAASVFPFSPQTLGNATSTLLLTNSGIISAASSTIGNGLQQGGLTVSGGATTTGSIYTGTGASLWSTGPSASLSNAYSITSAGMTYPALVVGTTGNVDIGGTTATNPLSLMDVSGYASVAPHIVFTIASSTRGVSTSTLFSAYSDKDFVFGGGSVHSSTTISSASSTVVELKGTAAGGIANEIRMNNLGDSSYGDQNVISMFDGTSAGTPYRGALHWTLDASGQAQLAIQAGNASSLAGLTTLATFFPNGKLGIGNTAPDQLLSVGSSNTGTFSVSTSTAGCSQFSSTGELYSTGSACVSGSSAFPFTPNTYNGTALNSTSTGLWIKNSLLVASSTFFSQASTTNLEMTYYVQNFPGANLGAKFNNAYAAAPSGSTFVISASSTFSTAMNMGTVGKVGTIKCSPGVVLTWTGAATSTILNPTDTTNLQAGWGMEGCTLRGTLGAGQVAIQLGGSNGGQGAVIAKNDIQNFGTGLRTEQHTWNISIDNNWFGGNNQAIHIEAANDSGEGFKFEGNHIVDCNSAYGECFYSEVNGSDGLQFIADVWDDAGAHLLDGNLNATFIANKWENPNAAVIGRYNYLTLDSGGFMLVNINGGTMMNGGDTLGHSPNQFILNGAQLVINGTTFDNNTGGAISVPAIVNNYGGGAMSIYDYRDINVGTPTFSNIATSSVIIKADSYNNLFAVQGTASSTTLVLGVPSCSGSNALTTNSAGTVACGAITSSASFPFTPFTSYNSTTTAIGFKSGMFTNGSTTITSVTSGLVGASNGLLYGFASSSLFGFTPSPFAWTPTTNFGALANSTSTAMWFSGGLQASSTSRLAAANFSGIVGIGTTTPHSPLVVQGASQDGIELNGGGATSDYINADGAGTLILDTNRRTIDGVFTNTGQTNSRIIMNSANGAGSIVFSSTNTNNTLASEVMRVSGSGKVGVSSSTPFGILSVGTGQTGAPALYVAGAAGQNGEIWLTRPSGVTVKEKSQDTQARFTYAGATGPLLFDSDDAGTITLALTTTNTVGVATTTPTATLGVHGTIMAKLTAFATGDSAVCQKGVGGFITVDSGVSSCIVSSKFVKDPKGSDDYQQAYNRIVQLQVVLFKYKENGKEDIGLYAEDVAKIDPRYAQYAEATSTVAGHDFKVGDPKGINWSAIQADMLVVLQHQSMAFKVTRSMEENWQDGLIVLLIVGFFYQQRQLRKLQHD